MLPKELGGRGMNALTYGVLSGEVGRACSACRTLLTVHDMVAAAVHRWASPRLRQDVLPRMAGGAVLAAFALSEPEAGNDAASIATTITRDGDTYLIRGQKNWISFGQIADVFLVFGQSKGGSVAVLVPGDADGLARAPVANMVGTRGASMANIRFDDVRVPVDAIVGKEGFGLSHVAQTALDHGRYSVAWGAVGIVDAALASCSEFSRARQAFGASLADQPIVQRELTRMAVSARAARLMCMEAGRLRALRDPASLGQTLMAKYFASKAAVRAANAAVQLHGARGLLAGALPERLLRDAKVTEIIEGSSESLEVVISRMG